MTSTEAVELFVRGRLCLFGEHADWAAEFGLHRGFCLVIGTDQGLAARARPADGFTVETAVSSANRLTDRKRKMVCPWEKDALLEAARDREEFFRYCAGVAYQLFSKKGVEGGLGLEISRVDLPLKKGVASSAAVCILVARAFDAAYGLRMFPHELMEAAYLGERLTGSQCGRMDQACIFGKTPVLLTFDKAGACRIEPVFPHKTVYMFFVDLAGRKNTVQILSDLRAAYPANVELQKALGENNEQIVRSAYRALELGDARNLGELMGEAQALFDRSVAPHSPTELKSPLLHEVLSLDSIKTHVFGGKGVGSQGDGTAQFVARSAEDRQAAMELVEKTFPSTRAMPLTIPALAVRTEEKL
jgi:galactokinase